MYIKLYDFVILSNYKTFKQILSFFNDKRIVSGDSR